MPIRSARSSKKKVKLKYKNKVISIILVCVVLVIVIAVIAQFAGKNKNSYTPIREIAEDIVCSTSIFCHEECTNGGNCTVSYCTVSLSIMNTGNNIANIIGLVISDPVGRKRIDLLVNKTIPANESLFHAINVTGNDALILNELMNFAKSYGGLLSAHLYVDINGTRKIAISNLYIET